MTTILSGIWILDILNLMKYQGVDVFDSILNIEAKAWWIIWGGIFGFAIIYAFAMAWLENR